MVLLVTKEGGNGAAGSQTRQRPYVLLKWARVDNRCRRVWQRYLGKLEDIVAAVQGGGPAPIAAEVFQWGLPQALWQKPPEHNSSNSSTALPQTPARTNHRSVPGDRRDQPGDQPA